MIPADLAQALLLGATPVAWWARGPGVPLLAVIAFLCGTAALRFGVVGSSYVPGLVTSGELPAANRAIQGSRTVAEVAGPGSPASWAPRLPSPSTPSATSARRLGSRRSDRATGRARGKDLPT